MTACTLADRILALTQELLRDGHITPAAAREYRTAVGDDDGTAVAFGQQTLAFEAACRP